MSVADLLSLAGVVIGVGVAGIGILRYVIKAELGPLRGDVAKIDVRVTNLEHDVERIQDAA